MERWRAEVKENEETSIQIWDLKKRFLNKK